MNEQDYIVQRVLSDNGARQLRHAPVSRGLSASVWINRDGTAEYDAPDHHTLSIYLNGGEAITRHSDGRVYTGGAPGKLCLLPAGHQSRWEIGGLLNMFHLYVAPGELEHLATTALDLDPRSIEVQDLTFADDDYSENVVRNMIMPLDWTETADRMALSSASQLLMLNLLKRHTARRAGLAVKGGLSPVVRRRVEDYVDAHLSTPLTLPDLAEQAGLSTHHFARMFKTSFGLPPHRYVTLRRVDRAQVLLRGSALTLAEVALECGFSSQSHFSNVFKAECGVTPKRFRGLH